jgi:hypothetical protein
MMISGVRYQPSAQQIEFSDTEIGEGVKQRLNHRD